MNNAYFPKGRSPWDPRSVRPSTATSRYTSTKSIDNSLHHTKVRTPTFTFSSIDRFPKTKKVRRNTYRNCQLDFMRAVTLWAVPQTSPTVVNLPSDFDAKKKASTIRGADWSSCKTGSFILFD